MKINAFSEEKDIMDWLEDPRIHPEINRDVLSKRVRDGWIPEKALTTPVIKGIGLKDTKERQAARQAKQLQRAELFALAYRVRRQYNMGLEVKELAHKFGLTHNMVEKIASKNAYYNIHWATGVPQNFKELLNDQD